MECKLGQKLIEKGIHVMPQYQFEKWSYDFKISDYPILLEVDGGIHKEERVRLNDYIKDRKAQRRGFKVLRFTNGEVDRKTDMCVDVIRSVINGINKSPREIWLYQYSFWDQIKDFWNRLWK